MRLPSVYCTDCCGATTWSQRCRPAPRGALPQLPNCGRSQCHGKNSPTHSSNQATWAVKQADVIELGPDSFRSSGCGLVKDPRPTELPGRTRSQQPVAARQLTSAADYQSGCVSWPDRSGEVDRASAPVLVGVLAYQHRGI